MNFKISLREKELLILAIHTRIDEIEFGFETEKEFRALLDRLEKKEQA